MTMRILRITIVAAIVAAILIAGLAGIGSILYGRYIWGGAVQAQGPGWNGWGPGGMMGGFCGGSGALPIAPQGGTLSIDQAKVAIENYIAGSPNLAVDEVMEFTRNFYAIVKEKDTGIGAMELLVDKYTGAVGPEFGPNMMWNTKYGMMGGGMMGGWWRGNSSGAMSVTPAQALQNAQRWLEANQPGVVTETQADQFYGYYTIHTLKDGKITGMLSVHGSTGQIWYHTWHGDFITMIGGEE